MYCEGCGGPNPDFKEERDPYEFGSTRAIGCSLAGVGCILIPLGLVAAINSAIPTNGGGDQNGAAALFLITGLALVAWGISFITKKPKGK
jgi:hypothetical protein